MHIIDQPGWRLDVRNDLTVNRLVDIYFVIAFLELRFEEAAYTLQPAAGLPAAQEGRHTVVHLAKGIHLAAEEDVGLAGRDIDPADPIMCSYVSLYCTTSISSPSMK